MYLLYVDEAGDPGFGPGSSPIFLMSGIIIPAERWREVFDRYRAFRRSLLESYGVPLYAELHGHTLVGSRGRVGGVALKLKQRRSLFRSCLNFLTGQADLGVKVFSVIIDKRHPRFRFPSEGLHARAAEYLFQRFSNFLRQHNRLLESHRRSYEQAREGADPEVVRATDGLLELLPATACGVVFADETNTAILRRRLRELRDFESGTSKPRTVDRWIIEDPSFRDSAESAGVQLADWVATALRRQEEPTAYHEETGLTDSYERLRPLLLTAASRQDPKKQGTARWPRP